MALYSKNAEVRDNKKPANNKILVKAKARVNVLPSRSKNRFELLSLKKTGLFLNPDILLDAIYLSGRKPAFLTKFLDSVIEFAEIAAIGTVLLVDESPIAIKISFSFSPQRLAVTFLQCSIEKSSSITMVCERTNSLGRRMSTTGLFDDKAAA